MRCRLLFLASLSCAAFAASSVGRAASPGACLTVGKPPPKSINVVQKLELALIRHAFSDGRSFVRDLIAHRGLWCGVVMHPSGVFYLIDLRDIDRNVWQVQDLYIWSSGANDKALLQLARRFHPAEIHWITGSKEWNALGGLGPHEPKGRILLLLYN